MVDELVKKGVACQATGRGNPLPPLTVSEVLAKSVEFSVYGLLR